MKKYTIKDKSGTKKTIFAKDLSHALTFVDSKVEDAVSLIKGDWFTLRRENDVLYKVIDDQNKSINGFREAMIVEAYQIELTKDFKDYTIKKIGNKSFHPDRWSSSDIVRFNSAKEAITWLRRQLQLTKNRFDSKTKDDIRLEFVPEKIRKIAETAAKKVNATVTYDGFDKHITVYFEPKSSIISNNFEETLNKELSRYGWKIGSFGRNGLSFYAKDSIKDEANLPTTLQALVNDEEAAIKAYEVAIKNLEGKIDETQMQVLINIMKDERRHVENLYAILNGQVTEKNLEDSIKDAFIVKADNEYIMEGDRPEMTSFRKYAKVFSSKQEAIDYARKYFRLRPIDIEIIEE